MNLFYAIALLIFGFPNKNKRLVMKLVTLISIFVLFVYYCGTSKAQEKESLISAWAFDSVVDDSTVDAASKIQDKVFGYYSIVKGVKGNAIQFDGYTSHLERKRFEKNLPRSFTITAWVALETYPWFRCPVFDLREGEKEGVLLAINRDGMLTAALGDPLNWQEIAGPKLTLKQWNMVSLVVNQGGTTKLYVNGKEVLQLENSPVLRETYYNKLTIGRNAFLEKWWDYQYTVTDHYSFMDGRIDEVSLYSEALDEDKIKKLFEELSPVPEFVSQPRILPTGPEGPAEFGADYTRLNYTEQWDRLWRVGDYPDILVRFADNNCRLIFWRGTSFVPCWVTENGIWYTNEWTETWGSDVSSCAEPLMDRECRFGHVRIIENTPARTIVHWRYGLVDADYNFVAWDIDGRGEWADEYYIIYPDAIGVRKIDLYYSNPLRKHDWEESIVLLSPGQHPYDVMEDPEITLANMNGESFHYSWRNNLPVVMDKPDKANIHVVNFKSEYKPFYIISPEPFESVEGKFDSPFFRSYSAENGKNYRPDSVPSVYGWWNHWPVAQVPGDGRWVVNNDRASHFNLTTFTQWKDYYMDDHVKSRIMLHGMTRENPEDLVPLANSWLYPPQMKLETGEAVYEPAERAFLVSNLDNGILNGNLAATPEQPVINPAIVLDREKLENPVVKVNGEDLIPGKDFQHGTVKELEKWKTVIWINNTYTKSIELLIR
jgi:hypothetical protein